MSNTHITTRTQQEKNTCVASPHIPFKVRPDRMLEWLGGVTYAKLEDILGRVKNLMTESQEEIVLLVNSYGGTTGIGMSFYDAVTSWLCPNLVTIGSGDVDSSGILVFLAGRRRYIAKNTTLLFHLAGRTLGKDTRFSTAELESMLREDALKDFQYASVVSEALRGTYSPEDILELMRKNTLLTAEEAVNMGLAERVV